MGHLLTLDDLQSFFDAARERLARERADILSVAPFSGNFSRDTYGFFYMRAERLGLDVVLARLDEVSWLPMHLDPQTEFLLGDRRAMKKWLSSSSLEQPDSALFGNDFVHALTRIAMTKGWDGPEFKSTAFRIGGLFHDLSCLIGLIYYGVWMAENGIMGVPVTDPDNLGLMAKEMSDITRSPEIAQLLAEHERPQKHGKSGKKKRPPALRVIENTDWNDTPPSSSS